MHLIVVRITRLSLQVGICCFRFAISSLKSVNHGGIVKSDLHETATSKRQARCVYVSESCGIASLACSKCIVRIQIFTPCINCISTFCTQEGYKKSNMTAWCTLACTKFVVICMMRLNSSQLKIYYRSQHIAAQLQQHIMQRQDLLLYCSIRAAVSVATCLPG